MTDRDRDTPGAQPDQPPLITGLHRAPPRVQTAEESDAELLALERYANDHLVSGPRYAAETSAPAYEQGPLFSKKVLIGWALGAFLVWFAFTVVAPEIIRSVKAEFGETLREPGSTTSARGVTVRRNADGSVTVTRNGNVIVETPPDPDFIPPAGTAAEPVTPVEVAPPKPPAPPAEPSPEVKKTKRE